jgi:hypothetical protein
MGPSRRSTLKCVLGSVVSYVRHSDISSTSTTARFLLFLPAANPTTLRIIAVIVGSVLRIETSSLSADSFSSTSGRSASALAIPYPHPHQTRLEPDYLSHPYSTAAHSVSAPKHHTSFDPLSPSFNDAPHDGGAAITVGEVFELGRHTKG